MTTYAVTLTTSTSAVLTVVPSSTYQVRIARIEGYATGAPSAGTPTYSVAVYPGNTPTGGSTLTPLIMRSGAPTATAAVKSGATISGTNTTLHAEGTLADFTTGTYNPINSNYNFPFDLILSSTGTLVVGLQGNSGGPMSVTVYFEELRLAWTS